MARADRWAIDHGIPGFELMESAGRSVAEVISRRWTPRNIHILCGPGNNGGDGFVVARILRDLGWSVRIGFLGVLANLRDDAREHAALWQGDIEPLSVDFLNGAELFVDALFGTGLSRPLEGIALDVVQRLERSNTPVCAIDIPSGIDGRNGQILGASVCATVTVTFFRKKPGQLLLPGRLRCGDLVVADIGIPVSALESVHIHAYENHPELWLARFAWPRAGHHKYMRGHVLIRGGEVMTGAARLSAMAAARAGAGLVSVAATSVSWPVYATALNSVMVLPCDDLDAWKALLTDSRRNVVVVGPGAGVSDATRDSVLSALGSARTVVLDADALSAFEGQSERLFDAIRGPCVLTPHYGEFFRLFDLNDEGDDKVGLARYAAAVSGAVIVLKGADTVIAAPDGRAVINTNAPPELATGGTGDVLSGIIAGLAAQNMELFDAAVAAVWIHGRAASLFGPGLIADDLPTLVPRVLAELKSSKMMNGKSDLS